MATRARLTANDLFTALAHPLRRRILRRMLEDDRETSPRELATALSESLSALSYHVRVLAECNAVELVRTKQIRGSTKHLYRPSVKSEWARAALKEPEGRPKRTDPPRESDPQGEEKG